MTDHDESVNHMEKTPENLYQKAKKITGLIDHADRQLQSVTALPKDAVKAVMQAEKQLRALAVENSLKNMPVEELAKAKLGIRVSALKNAGINNIYRLVKMSHRALENIDGIGPKSAAAIRHVVDKIVKSTQENTRVRIDPDKIGGHDERLVKAVYHLRKIMVLKDASEKEYSAKHVPVRELLKAAGPAKHWLTWKLSSSSKKKKALDSLAALETMLNDGYTETAAGLFAQSKAVHRAGREEYIKDFERNAAGYYATLENVLHGTTAGTTVGAGKRSVQETAIKNGLSEELAVAIGNVELDLTGLSCELRPYQHYGVQYILNQGAVLLGDEMGLGKTIEAIGCMVALRNQGQSRFLVVCPASVVVNWIREITRFSDLKPHKIHGSECDQAYDIWKRTGGVGVTTYETLSKLTLDEEKELSMLVVDEAHYIKNPNAARTQNVLRFRRKTGRALFMTGTPIENNVEEMCFLISCLQPDVAKSVQGSTSLVMAPEFRRKVATVYFRRTKEDVLSELPEKIETEEWVEPLAAEERLYRGYVLNGEFVKMRQVSWLMEDLSESAKAVRLKEIVEEAVAMNRKILIFSFFLNTVDRVRGLLSCPVFGPITGAVPVSKRQQILDDFEAYDGGAVLLSQITAGGTGLNIQCASVIIFCEPQLKPSIENQAIARAYRMGQVHTVMVHRLLNDDTVDERILNILQNKQVLFDNFADISESGKESLISSETVKKIVEEERAKYTDTGNGP